MRARALASLTIFVILGGLLAGQHDNEKERAPPARPIPATFPSLDPPESSKSTLPTSWTDDSGSIAAHFLGLKKPSDVNSDTLALLNVTFQPQCDFETLLADISSEAQAHLPPKSWLEPSEQDDLKPSEASARLLCNGRKSPDQNDFYSRAKELYFKNEDAFSNLTRKPRGEKVRLRLAHFRKFWEGLDNMAYYWDNSLDEYLAPKSVEPFGNSSSDAVSAPTREGNGRSLPLGTSPNEDEARKKIKTDESSSKEANSMTRDVAMVGARAPSLSLPMSSARGLPAQATPSKTPWESNSSAEKPVDLSQGSYKGYRIGNGADMPDIYRLECVRAFLEPIMWAFGVTLVPHRRPPVLSLKQLRFPVRVSTVAWRGSQDRIKARQGWLEGPVLGVQCRADTGFGSVRDLQSDSTLDVVRELGGMLMLAQERAREGKTERRSGEGKWWTTAQRWGGGPGGEVGEATGTSDIQTESNTTKNDEKLASKSRVGSKERRKPSPAEIWKTLKVGNQLWDPKVGYEAIGKDRNIEWDDVSSNVGVLKIHLLTVARFLWCHP